MEAPGKYTTYGVWEFVDKSRCLHVTELPISVWTDNYKAFCESFLTQEKSPLADVIYGNTDIIVDIKFVFKPVDYAKYKGMDREELVKTFKLNSKLSFTNMYLFNAEGRLEKYPSEYSIIEYYFNKRLELYAKRREALIAHLEYEILILVNKSKFIRTVREGKIKQRTMTEASLLTALVEGFDADPRLTCSGLSLYEYLISMSYRSFTEGQDGGSC